MFDVIPLIAAFGGGIIGAYMGALPAFIMTGIFALIGGLMQAAGISGDIAVGVMAFGSFLGPHVAFAGGAAASAYAGRRKYTTNGADIVSPLNGLGKSDVLLVGGVFGALGHLLITVIAMVPFLSNHTDQPGCTVFILAIVTRLLFGTTGLTGKYTGSGKREWFSGGEGFGYNVVLGGGIGIAVSFIAASLDGNAAALGIFPVVCFGFSAITLIFTQTGFAMPATHHITLPAATAAVVGMAAWGPYGAFLGVLFGIICSLLGDLVGKSLNSHCDSHIDPPATTIFSMIIVINVIKDIIVK